MPEIREQDIDEELLKGIDVDAFMGEASDEEDSTKLFLSDEEDEEMELEEGAGVQKEASDPSADDIAAAFADDDEDNVEIEEDSVEAFMDAIRVANNFRAKKRKVDRRTARARLEKDLNPEVRLLLSEANEYFVSNNYDKAEKLYSEAIKKDPKNFSAYKSIGEIYYRQGLTNKCCKSWFLAAHIDPSNGEFWVTVAKLSKELGHSTQALYCYGRAISANYRPFSVLFERAILYRETNQIGRASESLQRLQKSYPHSAKVVKELAMIYLQLNRVNDAISMYLKIFEKNIAQRKRKKNGIEEYMSSSDEDDEIDDDEEEESGRTHEDIDEERRAYGRQPFPVFDWSCLNILAELFVKQKNYKVAIRTIKHAARWIQHREDETFWEDVPDDSEFDERRIDNPKFEALPDLLKDRPHDLPIDIRVKLATLRLYLNETDEALRHYTKYLLAMDVMECADLFLDSATRLEEAQLYKEALMFYQQLKDIEEYHTSTLYTSLAKCSTEIENYKDAKLYYNQALDLDPNNVDLQLSLVEILYYLGEVDQSQSLLEKINDSRTIQANNQFSNDSTQNYESTSLENQALIKNKIHKPSKHIQKLSEAEKLERDEKIKQNVINKYKRLQRLHNGLVNGDSVAAQAWIRLASELIELFSKVKNFFPKDRSIQFKGIITRTKGLKMDIDSKIERILQLYDDPAANIEEKSIITSKEEFRGLKYSQWFDLFMEYALAVAKYDNVNDAFSIIDNAKNINVFYHDKERNELMNLVKLAISMKIKDSKEPLVSLRLLLNTFQFNKEVLKLFVLCQQSGKNGVENFISINHQKYFLRQIKGYDSIKHGGKQITGMATVTNKGLDLKGKDNVYLLYIYGCLLFVNKSYVASLSYFTRIYKNYKHEPMVNLLTGLAHVHRSMQRSSTNRHVELLQGLKYLMEYLELRTDEKKFGACERQEAYYNVGRAYHLIGLYTIAVDYYNKVLTEFDELDGESDMKRHAAYNLIHIYNISGNTKLSNLIMERYLTIE